MSKLTTKRVRFRKHDTIYYYDLSDHERHSKQVYYNLVRASKQQHKASTSIAHRVKRRHRKRRREQHKLKILSQPTMAFKSITCG